RKVRVGGATFTALRAVVASRATVEWPCEYRDPRGDTRNPHLFATFHHHQFMATWPRRWQEDSVGFVVYTFVRSEDPDQSIDLVIIRLNVIIADRPIFSQTVVAAPFEVDRTEA